MFIYQIKSCDIFFRLNRPFPAVGIRNSSFDVFWLIFHGEGQRLGQDGRHLHSHFDLAFIVKEFFHAVIVDGFQVQNPVDDGGHDLQKNRNGFYCSYRAKILAFELYGLYSIYTPKAFLFV